MLDNGKDSHGMSTPVRGFTLRSYCGDLFLVSRYEEYLPFIADVHGRFPAKEGFAFKNDFLGRPVVNEWALALGKLWFGASFDLSHRYQYLTTIDIDNLFAFKGKGALRTLGP